MLALCWANCICMAGLIILLSTKKFKERLEDWFRVYFIFGFIFIFVISLVGVWIYTVLPY